MNSRSIGVVLLCVPLLAMILAGCGRDQPQVTSTSPSQGASNVSVTPSVVEVTFDQPMDRTSVERNTSIDPNVPGGVHYEWDDDDRTMSAHFAGPFAPNTTYRLTVDGGAQAANEAELGEDFTLEFATAEAPAATQPSAGQTREGDVVVEQKQTQEQPQSGQTDQGQGQQQGGQQTAPSTGAGAGRGPSGAASTQANLTFSKDIAPLAKNRCDQCHKGKMSNYDQAKAFVTANNPSQSPYYTKGIGQGGHPAGNRWKDKADTVRRWIQAGAPK